MVGSLSEVTHLRTSVGQMVGAERMLGKDSFCVVDGDRETSVENNSPADGDDGE